VASRQSNGKSNKENKGSPKYLSHNDDTLIMFMSQFTHRNSLKVFTSFVINLHTFDTFLIDD
jgi:hypothetical protein